MTFNRLVVLAAIAGLAIAGCGGSSSGSSSGSSGSASSTSAGATTTGSTAASSTTAAASTSSSTGSTTASSAAAGSTGSGSTGGMTLGSTGSGSTGGMTMGSTGSGATTGTAGSTGSTGSFVITISGFSFSPPNLDVPLGATVTVVNADRAPHTVTSSADMNSFTPGAFDGVSFNVDLPNGNGETKSFTLSGGHAGDVVPYFCNVHLQSMGHATITLH